MIWRSHLRFLARTPWSLTVSMLGLVLGVASLTAVHLLTERLVQSLDRAIPVHLKASQAAVTAADLSSEDYFWLRRSWRAGAVAGVDAMTPVVEGSILAGDTRARVVGLDWLALIDGAPPLFPSSPSAPTTDGSTSTASTAPPLPLASRIVASERLGVTVGERLVLADLAVEVAAVVSDDGFADATPLIYADIALAQKLLRRSEERLDLILLFGRDVRPGYERWLAALMPGLEAGFSDRLAMALPPAAAERGLRLRGLRSQLPEQAFGRAVLFNLGALSLLSLLVSWFLQYQTAVLWLRRQWPTHRLMLLQGVPLSLVARVFLSLLLLLGAIAGVLGLLVGVGLADWLRTQGLDAAAAEQTGLSFGPWLLAKALGSALGVPLVAGIMAWRGLNDVRASADLAGRPGTSSATVRWLRPLAVGVSLGLAGWLARTPATGLFGAFGAILLLCLVGILCVAPLLTFGRQRLFSPAVGRWFGGRLTVLMGVRDLFRYPGDLSAALCALVLAVATSVGIGTMVDSFRSDFDAMLDGRLEAPIVLEGPAPLLETLASDLRAATVVAELRPTYRGRAQVAGQPVSLRFEPFDEHFRRAFALAHVPEAGDVLLNERASRLLAARVDSSITVGRQSFRVAGRYPGYGDSDLRLRLSVEPDTLIRARSDRFGIATLLEQLRVYPGADPAACDALISALAERNPSLRVSRRDAVRTRALEVFDRTFAITRSLSTLALIVAAVGLYAALVSIALLQAGNQRLLVMLGQSRSERLGFQLGRSSAVTTITLALALPLGLILAALLCQVVNPRGFGWSVPMQLDGPVLVWPFVVTLLAALLAGVFSGRERHG